MSAAPTTEALAPAEADRAFGELWNRTDRPVAEGADGRSWMWGPKSFATGSEAYTESPGGRRVVQYWDKSRMEITNPVANRDELWFVTNGLLAKELVSGQLQTGQVRTSSSASRRHMPVVGDPTGAVAAPSYAAVSVMSPHSTATGVYDQQSARRLCRRIDEHGRVGSDATLRTLTTWSMLSYNNELGHNVPNVFQSAT